MVAIFGKPKTPVAFAHSVIGQSHIKSEKPCQDASLCVKDKKYTLVAVADGHGGDQYFRSDVGSGFAVQSVKECLTDPAVINALTDTKREKDRERIIAQLKSSIIGRWNIFVADHADAHPFNEDEFEGIPDKYAERYRAGEHIESVYGSTLIAALLTDTFMLALQIGDGNCVVADKDGAFSMPVPADEKCFLNLTTSLCDENAIDSLRHAYSDTIPAAVLIGSDGIDDCFAGEEKLYGFYRLILSSFKEKAEEAAKTELIDYLPRLSEKGSGDDISIGMIVGKEALQNLNLEKPNQTNEGSDFDDTAEKDIDNQAGTTEG